jgi:3-oxoacyl-[acyl-carrier-protein] synthase-3
MATKSAIISAVGAYVPEKVFSNQEIEQLVATNDEWIVARTGIKERRILDEKDKATSDMIVPAILEICRKKNLDPQEIECVIVATITPDYKLPATANIVCEKIGAVNAWGFDINSACSGFIHALNIGASLIENGRHTKVIVVGADKMSSIINKNDRNTVVLFGDGAGAVLLEASDEPIGVMDSLFKSEGAGKEFLHIKSGGALNGLTVESVMANEHLVSQDGKNIFKAAVRNMSGISKELMKRNELEVGDIDWFVPHQANLRIIEAVAKEMDMPMERIKINIEKYGNTTAGTIPICLWELEQKLKKNDSVLLTAFGAGFSWGAVWLKWAYDPSQN